MEGLTGFVFQLMLLITMVDGTFRQGWLFSSVAQSCPTLCDPMNHSTPGLPVHHNTIKCSCWALEPVSPEAVIWSALMLMGFDKLVYMLHCVLSFTCY